MITINDIYRKISGSGQPAAKKAMMILMLLWCLDLVLSAFLEGVTEMNGYLLFTWLFKVILLGMNIWFFVQFFMNDNSRFYQPLRSYTGYMVVCLYVVSCLPRLSWEQQGLVSETQALFLWINSSILCLFPLALYLMLINKTIIKQCHVETLQPMIPIESGKNDEPVSEEDSKKRLGTKAKKSPLHFLLDNANVVLQAIIMVILINHFVFQLYIIPSGSMIPTFLLNDRPLVLKALSGPTIPLTSWQLPIIKEPERGDVVIFQTHRYEKPPLYMQILQNFIFLATLSMWDINRSENSVEPQYIVKRIIGVPGDQLMMVDDKVYVKKSGDADFSLLEVDASKYSHINIVLSAEDRELLEYFDQFKNSYSLLKWHELWETSRKRIQQDFFGLKEQQQQEFISNINMNFSNTWKKIWANAPVLPDESTLNLYEISSRKANFLFHYLVARQLELGLAIIHSPEDKSLMDSYFKAAMEFNQFNGNYLGHYFTRNFNAFPKGENEFIPAKHYFLMGDNRYNSLDFRYGDEAVYIPLDPDDSYSWARTVRLNPYLLPQNRILGMAVARIWPINRIGLVLP
ncbi:MAG: signal peptidase I [Spirochaetales bacterium]|nr:signal peptidase I [Spirochaetales bacterium]